MKRSRSPIKLTETKRKLGAKTVKCLSARPMGKGEVQEYCGHYHGMDEYKCNVVINVDDKGRCRACDRNHKRKDHTGHVIEV